MTTVSRELDLGIEVSHRQIAERVCGMANCDGPVPPGSNVSFRYIDHRDTDYTYGLILEFERRPKQEKVAALKAWVAGAATMARRGL